MEIQIDIPQDIALDEKRFKPVQQGILKAISKGLYQECLAFQIQDATFHYWKWFLAHLGFGQSMPLFFNSDVDLKKSIMNKKINIDIGGMQ